MRNDPILRTKLIGNGERLTVKGGLSYIRGNSAPHFSITADVTKYGNWQSSGCQHGLILRHYPEFADLVSLHLCDHNGWPSGGESNGWYNLSGALGGLGEKYHRGNSECQFWKRPDGSPAEDSTEPGAKFDGYRNPTPIECLWFFQRQFGLTMDDARSFLQRIAKDYDIHCLVSMPDKEEGRALLAGIRPVIKDRFLKNIQYLRPQCTERARECIRCHDLKVYGDPLPTDIAKSVKLMLQSA